MTEFNFSLHGTDVDRLFAIKELQGADDLTGNEFARLLLERELRRLFPATPSFDDEGKLVNACPIAARERAAQVISCNALIRR